MANALPSGYNYDGPEEIKDDTLGLENNPYTPITCEQFMWAINQNGKYVKLTQDIDFSKSEFYQNGINNFLDARCIKCYSEKEQPCKINGLKITSKNFIQSGASLIQFENVFFSNCIHVKTQSYEGASFYVNNNQKMQFDNCKISMLIHTIIYGPQVANNVIFNNTAMFFRFSSLKADSQLILNGTFKDCTIEFQDVPIICTSDGNSNGSRMFLNLIRCSVKGNFLIKKMDSNEGNLRMISENSIFALSFENETDQNESKKSIKLGGNYTNVSVIDKTLLDNSDFNFIIENELLVDLSTDEIKNKEKLVSIGFLP